jgi:hypothetical protein
MEYPNMKSDSKWTIRGVEVEARDLVEEIRTTTGIPYGRLISEAIWCWREPLDEADPMPIYRPVLEE